MSTPVEQNVPADFQHELDLPTESIDPNAVAAAQAGVAKGKSAAAAAMAAYNAQKIKAANAMNAYNRKGATKAQKAAATAQRTAALAQMKVQTGVRTKALAATTTAQNNVYTASGQYDKLLSGDTRDAFLALKSLFGSMGLGTLAGKIYDYVKQGYGADTISVLLQDTPEYKKRFAANDARVKAGLAVLSPADYLATEASYRQILSTAGMPKGFYDNPADFQNWIAGDVSPTEIKDRVDLATAATGQANPEYKNALYQMYGINEADLTAYFLDRKVAEPILKKQAAAGAIGAAALRRGFGANTLDLEGYATIGITADQAEQAYSQIADGFESMLGIAGRYGTSWDQRQAEQEVFTPGAAASVGAESASEKGKRLKSQERAMFAGSQGSSTTGLNAGYSPT
jgi:hypothetical protein